MTKVTNKHDGLINILGVDIAPGKSVEIDTKKFEMWSKGGPAKQWLKAGVVIADTKVDLKGVKDDPNADRQKLEARATELGISFDVDTSDEDLANAVAEQEENSATNERETLLKEARDLGLNPNANTGTEKLKKLIADKKAQTA